MGNHRVNSVFTTWRLLALVGVLALLLTACPADEEVDVVAEPDEPEEPVDDVEEEPIDEPEEPANGVVQRVAVAAPEEPVDFGWNQAGIEGAQRAAERGGVEIEVAGGLGYEAPVAVLRELAETADLIFAHASGYGEAAVEVSQETGVPMVVYHTPDALEEGVAAFVSVAAYEGGYLAGLAAANMTESGILGIVVSATADFNWAMHSGGFIEGARSVDPDIEFVVAAVGEAAYSDVEGGARVTESVIAGGADVILGNGDGSAFGMMRAVETAEDVWYIDVIGDKRPVDDENILLSSIFWDFGAVYYEALEDVNAGAFGTRNYEMTLENEGIDLIQTDHIPDDVWAQVEEAREAIIAGEIDIPVLRTFAEVEEFAAE